MIKMAAYKRRCADVFGALTLPKGSSLNQSSHLSLEEECLSTTGAESNVPGQSLREDHSRTTSHSGIDVCSEGPAMDTVISGIQRGYPGLSGSDRRRRVAGRNGREDDSGVAVACVRGRQQPLPPDCRSNDGEQYQRGSGRRHHDQGMKMRPDYVVHPQNWTKYDLNEDSASDSVCSMSEEQRNTFAALQFLENLRARKRGGQEKNEECKDKGESSSSAVVFRKPVEPSELQAMESGKETVKATWNHARIMPEYQVGARLARKRKTALTSSTDFSDKEKRESSHANSSSVGVHLPHLCEQSEEDDEEQSCDSHMTLGEESKDAVHDSMYESSTSHELPQTAGCLQLLSHCEGERQAEGAKALFKKSSRRKKQGQRRVADADLD